MEAIQTVTIPYKPRYPQNEIHKTIESHRFSVLVAHRRMGKTVLSVNHLIKRAFTDGKEDGFYAYIAPFRVQAEQIAWGYLKHFTEGIPMIKIHEQKLQITLPNGARIRIFGADNPDSLRGIYLDGAVMDEVAQMKPEVWGEIIRPALADRGGWAVFIGTPKGVNLFSQLYDKALSLQAQGNDDWVGLLYSVDQTNVIPQKELQALRQEMSENEFRQEFLCDFSAASDNALISIDLVREASIRHYREQDYNCSPRIMGVDVARFGSDASVIVKRQGVVCFEPIIIRKIDNMALADLVATHIAEWQPDAVFIDIGNGSGVVDRLRQLNFAVTEVAFGSAAIRNDLYANKRMEMWAEMAKWLQSGGSIPPLALMQADLSAPTYGYTNRGVKALESKDKIKERIGRSTDCGDALALTFAAPVSPNINKHLAETLYNEATTYDPEAEFDRAWRH